MDLTASDMSPRSTDGEGAMSPADLGASKDDHNIAEAEQNRESNGESNGNNEEFNGESNGADMNGVMGAELTGLPPREQSEDSKSQAHSVGSGVDESERDTWTSATADLPPPPALMAAVNAAKLRVAQADVALAMVEHGRDSEPYRAACRAVATLKGSPEDSHDESHTPLIAWQPGTNEEIEDLGKQVLC